MQHEEKLWTDGEVTVKGERVEVRAFGRVWVEGDTPRRIVLDPMGKADRLDMNWSRISQSIGDFLRNRYEEGSKPCDHTWRKDNLEVECDECKVRISLRDARNIVMEIEDEKS